MVGNLQKVQAGRDKFAPSLHMLDGPVQVNSRNGFTSSFGDLPFSKFDAQAARPVWRHPKAESALEAYLARLTQLDRQYGVCCCLSAALPLNHRHLAFPLQQSLRRHTHTLLFTY